MRRREFISLTVGAAAWPLAARGQQSHKVWRVGILEVVSAELNAANFDALRRGLENLGYIEGKNLVFEYRSADGRPERFAELATELVGLNVDVIVTRGTPAVLAAKKASSTLPIVMAAIGEPADTGVIATVARPGGNVTGLSAFITEVMGKRVELLKEISPTIARIAWLQNMRNPLSVGQWREVKTAAESLGIVPLAIDVQAPEFIEHSFNAAIGQRADALIVANDTVIGASRRLVIELAARHRLPAIYFSREFVDVGGLFTYSVSYPDLYGRAASYLDKIFKGAKPADLPVEQPTRFELVINLKAAKAIGLSVPPTLLARADEVIE